MFSKPPPKKEEPRLTATNDTDDTDKKNPAYKREHGRYLKKVYRYGRFNSTQKEILCDLEINNQKLSESVAAQAGKTQYILDILSKSPNSPKYLTLQKDVEKKFAAVVEQADYQNKVIDEAVKWQKKLAFKLANQIENDIENTAYDANKLKKYKKQAGLKNDDEEETGFFTTQTFYTLFGWYTSARLFFVRLNRALSEIGLGFLPKFFSFFGLSYILEVVLVDLPVVLFSTFRPLRQPEEKRREKGVSLASIYWWRFINVITKDNRIPRVLNAIVWFSINLAVIVLTGGIGLAAVPAITVACNQMNIGGFAFDVLNDMYCWARDYIEQIRALKIINKKIAKLETPQKYKEKLESKLRFLEEGQKNLPADVSEGTKNNIERLIQDLKKKLRTEDFDEKVKLKRESRELVKQELEDKLSIKIGPVSIPLPSRLYSVGVSSLILLGMGLFWFPFASAIKGCETAGTLISLIGGSILGGFGRRIANGIESLITILFKDTDKPNEVKVEETQNEEVPIPSTYAVQYKHLLPVKKEPRDKRKTSEVEAPELEVSELEDPQLEEHENSGGLDRSPPIDIPLKKASSSSSVSNSFLGSFSPPIQGGLREITGDKNPRQRSNLPHQRVFSPHPSPENT